VNPNSKEVIQVAKEIKRYLNGHPNAGDTSKGVMHWLARQRHEDTLNLVNAALKVLVDEKIMSKKNLDDGTVFYRRWE